MKNLKFILFSAWAAFLLLEPCHTSQSSLAADENIVPLWWEIRLKIAVEGEYRVGDRDSGFTGSYSFDILWTGAMERDNSDYLLYPLGSEFLRWDAKETANFPDLYRVISTDDFAGKPSFKLNYLLRKDNHLHLDLIVEGFPIPQNDFFEQFYLNLPSSAENAQRSSGIDYNAFISEGSNRIFLEEKDIYLRPVDKDFSWRWNHQQWLLRQNRTILVSNSHRAGVSLSVAPRF